MKVKELIDVLQNIDGDLSIDVLDINETNGIKIERYLEQVVVVHFCDDYYKAFLCLHNFIDASHMIYWENNKEK